MLQGRSTSGECDREGCHSPPPWSVVAIMNNPIELNGRIAETINTASARANAA